MNYTVIARRWRPRKFGDVIGQPHIVTTLRNSIKLDRISHAYLFTGPRGVGKTSLARILAKAVNCTNRSGEEPCDACENCVAIDSGNFVDIIEIDAASARGIDDIKELRETVRYMPMKGAYKVYILDEAHMLTTEARNAFLKTLEEPPGHSIFILATTESQKIPYTIMSRCQRFDFRRIPESDIIVQLKRICDEEKVEYEEGVFQYIAAEADGGLRDAESLLDQIIAFSGAHIAEKDAINIIGIVERELLHGIVRSIIEGRLKEGLETIERALNEGNDVYQLYRGLVQVLRNMLMVKVCGGVPAFLYLGDEEQKKITEMADRLEYYEIQNLLHYLLKAEDLLKGIFPRISLEILYINLYNLSKMRDVEKVLDSLERHDVTAEVPPPKVVAKEHPVRETRPVYEPVSQGFGAGSPPVFEKPSTEGRSEPPAPEGQKPDFTRDARGFIDYLKSKKPFVGSILDNLRVETEENSFVIYMEKKSATIMDDASQKEEIKGLLKEFFGKEMGLVFRDGVEKKENRLEDFLREAETLFNV